MTVSILVGDCRKILLSMADGSMHMCVTSPPYFQLRDYGVDGQIGLEDTPEAFVIQLVDVFREVRRVLRADGTLWLNLGDSYAGSWGSQGHRITENDDPSWRGSSIRNHPKRGRRTGTISQRGLKPKDLIGIPWMVAFALRADGWYLRQEIIWHKPNPMPESIGDRCTRAHEHLFLLSKSRHYYYDADAISEPASPSTHARVSQAVAEQIGSARANGGTRAERPMKAVVRAPKTQANAAGSRNNESFNNATAGLVVERRNKRSVWTVSSEGYSGAHFATYPPALIEPSILAGSPTGGCVLDPFGGAGTTGLVADRLGRDAVLIELNPDYAGLADRRLRAGLAQVAGPPALTSDHGPLFDVEAA